MKILIGTDPELFVRNSSTGEYRSGHDLIPGNKRDPYMIRGGAVQVDGVALEFNTDPAETVDEFLYNINVVRTRMTQMAIEAVGPGWDVVATPTAIFTQEYFDTIPGDAKMLGCTPDYNAYTGLPNCPPGTTEPFRTGAGHIHIGWTQYADPFDDHHFDICCELTKCLDTTLFPLSYAWDADEKRRTLYGAKGSFRPKSYGMEWRPLSNAYLNSEDTIKTVFHVARWTAESYFKGVKHFEL